MKIEIITNPKIMDKTKLSFEAFFIQGVSKYVFPSNFKKQIDLVFVKMSLKKSLYVLIVILLPFKLSLNKELSRQSLKSAGIMNFSLLLFIKTQLNWFFTLP